MKEHPAWKGFFVLEGIDGSGTTTQLKRLEAKAQNWGLPWHSTNEPTGGPVGRLIREVLQSKYSLNHGTLARLFGADRQEHLYGASGVRTMLDEGKTVLSDRYFFSSLAYQTLDNPWEEVWDVNKAFPLPQTLFFLDLEAEIALERVHKRGGAKEIFETLEYQLKVRKQYHLVLDFFKDRGADIRILDATETPDQIEERIWDVIRESR